MTHYIQSDLDHDWFEWIDWDVCILLILTYTVLA